MAGRYEVQALPSSFQADQEHNGAACIATETALRRAVQGHLKPLLLHTCIADLQECALLARHGSRQLQ